jgi:BASS family bile acid:Na+ symporter
MNERLINILVTITLIDMMATIGLGVTFVELGGIAKNWRLVGQAALANYVCVPAVTVAILLLFNARPMVAAGFLILAVCPGAPFGPPCAKIAKGELSAAVGLMVLLAGSSAFAAPVLLHYLLPLLSEDEPLEIDSVKIITTLVMTQVLPLFVGLWIRHWKPNFAEKLLKPANRLTAILGLLSMGVILVVYFQLFLDIRLRGYVGMILLLIASCGAGWILGGPGGAMRRTMTLTTSLRNVGVGLVIATGSFAGTEAVTATLVYGILEIVGSLLLAFWWGRQTVNLGSGRAG